MSAKHTIQFYFDPISPYAWLASKALPRLEAAGLQVQCQPVLFAGLLNAHGQKGPAEIPAKREYTFRDVMRLAAMQGISFVGPPGHPFNPLAALRLCCAVPAGDARNQLAMTLMAAVWEQGINISDTQQLGHILDANGYRSQELLAASATPGIKQQLQQNTDEAISKGVFGVPTFMYGNEIFWGGDRLDALLWHVAGKQIDEQQLRAFLQLPPLAQRKQAV